MCVCARESGFRCRGFTLASIFFGLHKNVRLYSLTERPGSVMLGTRPRAVSSQQEVSKLGAKHDEGAFIHVASP